MKQLLLALFVGSACSCSKPSPPQPVAQSRPPSLEEQERIRDEASRKYREWNYQPAKKESY